MKGRCEMSKQEKDLQIFSIRRLTIRSICRHGESQDPARRKLLNPTTVCCIILPMSLNEADTSAKLINPSIYSRGWIEYHIKREGNLRFPLDFTYYGCTG